MSAKERVGQSWELDVGHSGLKNCPDLRMPQHHQAHMDQWGAVLLAPHLSDPAEAEVALQSEVKLVLNTQGGDVTAEVQAVGNGAVLGVGGECH